MAMKIMNWFHVMCGLALVIGIVYWQPVVGSIVLGLVACLALAFYREIGRKERELSQQGFHVEWVSPGVLRDGLDDMAIVYHDLKGEIWFPGKIVRGKSIVTIPDFHAWDNKVPEWAKDQRQTIIERIGKSHPKVIIR